MFAVLMHKCLREFRAVTGCWVLLSRGQLGLCPKTRGFCHYSFYRLGQSINLFSPFVVAAKEYTTGSENMEKDHKKKSSPAMESSKSRTRNEIAHGERVAAKEYTTGSENMEKDHKKKSSPAMESSKSRTRNEIAHAERERYLTMNLKEKRELYSCRKKFNTVSDVMPWPEFFEKNKDRLQKKGPKKRKGDTCYSVSEKLNSKVAIWKGDITTLEIDCIVNAANGSLMGGAGVDGAIHSAAGSALKKECSTLGGCDTGDAKLSGGFKLPAKYVIHTVGPMGYYPEKLKSCYKTCLKIMTKQELRTIAFPCISTGIYGYPNEGAVEVALKTVRTFLEEHEDKVDLIIFCLFMKVDVALYEEYMQVYFPIGDKKETGAKDSENVKEGTESKEGKCEKESNSSVEESGATGGAGETEKMCLDVDTNRTGNTQNLEKDRPDSETSFKLAENTEMSTAPKTVQGVTDDCCNEEMEEKGTEDLSNKETEEGATDDCSDTQAIEKEVPMSVQESAEKDDMATRL